MLTALTTAANGSAAESPRGHAQLVGGRHQFRRHLVERQTGAESQCRNIIFVERT
ncbi:hypothetical protein I541_5692 [Mycobacteroides abscessus]|nr:hypothetical protein I541_5692 [Mycobacteroides abscessus]